MDPDSDPFEQAQVLRGSVQELVNEVQVAKDQARTAAGATLQTVGTLVLASGAARAGVGQLLSIGARAVGRATQAAGEAAGRLADTASDTVEGVVSDARGGLNALADRATALAMRGRPGGEAEAEADPGAAEGSESVPMTELGGEGAAEATEGLQSDSAPAETSIDEMLPEGASAQGAGASGEAAGAGEAVTESVVPEVTESVVPEVESVVGGELLAGAEAGPIGLAVGALAAIGSALGLELSHHHSEEKQVVTQPTLNPM